ncbi:glucan endo-1,3-beta-glucosidase 14-like [Cynara cardunculus var. scolymus]|uniref:glucan endo-1,3-beta-D-glucosidase n=1 Tax=Cynara cardunculus var. scolymus TaxID=59895 RepID=A0A103XN63_CYNCS|nr:glucan endo-1,3-beta-glucosidase 14-like [Cynara cardunculus var. scolymus]XP_024978912.1 glucan endo-1,3-beta-glucosidase 14-like [Cynara cardunculus var. scolymus]KVH93803.1 Glycoside hydrolase, catalytic domain-containing protein [Cynara cardunculus var. scolymus]
MKIMRSCGRYLLLLLVLFIQKGYVTAKAFTGTYGINYGRIADNIPSPHEVVTLLKASKIKNVRIYDADHSVLNAFSESGLDLVVGLPNGLVKEMSANADHALNWVKENVQAYFPKTHIVGIAVGNEVLGGGDLDLQEALYGAVKNIYKATQKLQLDDVVQISTAHSQAVFANSYPPSSCTFKEDVAQNMKKLLDLFSQMGSPFCLNAYPFLAYMGSPNEIDINYALFNPTDGIYDEKVGLHYDNMLDAQIDATYAALEDAGFKKMEVIVTETGWASHGDPNESAATPRNARTYNYNLRKRLAKRKGTPRRPNFILKAYIFALFNENSKPGPTSERNFGLYKPDGRISYNIGFPAQKSSSATSSLLSVKDFGGQQQQWWYVWVWSMCASVLFLFSRL